MKFILPTKAMELFGFLPITWLNSKIDGENEERKFVNVTIWKTLLVCAVDFIVVLGK